MNLLRIQHERQRKRILSLAWENTPSLFGLTKARAASKLKSGCLIMHPGPINRGSGDRQRRGRRLPASVILWIRSRTDWPCVWPYSTSAPALRTAANSGSPTNVLVPFPAASAESAPTTRPPQRPDHRSRQSGRDEIGDLLHDRWKNRPHRPITAPDFALRQSERIDCTGSRLSRPGLIDIHVHFREPGQSREGDHRFRFASAARRRVASPPSSACRIPPPRSTIPSVVDVDPGKGRVPNLASTSVT